MLKNQVNPGTRSSVFLIALSVPEVEFQVIKIRVAKKNSYQILKFLSVWLQSTSKGHGSTLNFLKVQRSVQKETKKVPGPQ